MRRFFGDRFEVNGVDAGDDFYVSRNRKVFVQEE